MDKTAQNTALDQEYERTLTPREKAIALLQGEGLMQKDIAKALGISTVTVWKSSKNLKPIKQDRKVLKDAKSTIHSLIVGEPVGKMDRVKDSTALAAATYAWDRYEPTIKQSVNLNINTDLSPVDLSRYRNAIRAISSGPDTPDGA